MSPAGRKVVLPVVGMHCASCVARVEKALRRLDGVKSANVHLPSRTAAVEFDPGAVDAERLRKAVEGLGFQVPGVADDYEEAESLLMPDEERSSRVLLLRLLAGAALWAGVLMGGPLRLSDYTVWLLATPVQVFCGWHFHAGLLASLRRGGADMNTLVSLSTWAAYLFSSWTIFFGRGGAGAMGMGGAASSMHLLESMAGLVVLVTLGRYLEGRLRRKTGDAVRRMMRLTPKTVRLQRDDGSEALVPVAEVKPGDTILVGPGEVVGVDGVVRDGASAVDEALLTGESEPVEKSAGSRVYGGTMNKDGALVVSVTKPGAEMALARIVEAVRESMASKAPVQEAVDRASAVFVPFVIVLAAASAAVWAWQGPEPRGLHGLTAMVSVLAVACPCALGLATPMALLIGMGRGAELGIYVRNAAVLDRVDRLDAVVFDKTGTLTQGRPSVLETVPGEAGGDELLRLAATAEARSEHPYAAAVRELARARGVKPGPVEAFESFAGRGVSAASGGRKILVGSLAWLSGHGISPDQGSAERLRGAAGSVLAVAVDGAYAGAFVLGDSLRPGARQAVRSLKDSGLEVVLASGDRNQAVWRAAEAVGISRVYAEVLPQDKSRIIAELQARGKRVAMVGEGFNDAPALSRADVGVSLAGGTDIALEAADITLMNSDLGSLVAAFELIRRMRRVIRENLVWAFAYNVLLLPVAAGALYPVFGIMLEPHYAGAAMALSSLSVVANSMRLRLGRGRDRAGAPAAVTAPPGAAGAGGRRSGGPPS